jgi:transposase
MGKATRRKYDARTKAKVALEAMKGEKTADQISSLYGVHANQVSKWKAQALKGLPELFEKGKADGRDENAELIEELYRQIGQLTVELDWVKKRSDLIG